MKINRKYLTLCSRMYIVDVIDMKMIAGVEVVVDLVTYWDNLHHNFYNNVTGDTREVLHVVSHHPLLPAHCPHFYQRLILEHYTVMMS